MAGLCDTVCWLWSPPSRHQETPAFYYWDHFHWMVGVLIRYLQNLVAQQLHWVESVIDKNGNMTSIFNFNKGCYCLMLSSDSIAHDIFMDEVFKWSLALRSFSKIFFQAFANLCYHQGMYSFMSNFFFLNWEGSSRWLKIEGLTFRKPSCDLQVTWLWRWLPHRLSKCQSPTTVLHRTPITQMIIFNQGMLLLG